MPLKGICKVLRIYKLAGINILKDMRVHVYVASLETSKLNLIEIQLDRSCQWRFPLVSALVRLKPKFILRKLSIQGT